MNDGERTDIVFIGGAAVTVDAAPRAVAEALTQPGPGGLAEVVDESGEAILVNRDAVAYLMANRRGEPPVGWR